MKKNLSLAALSILFLILDIALLSRVNLYSIRPYLFLSLVLCASVGVSVQSAMVIAAVGGLIIDFICNSYLGATSALYILAAVLVYLCVKKSRPKPVLLLLELVGIAALADALLLCISAVFIGGMDIINRFLVHSLPCAILTAPIALALCHGFDSMAKGQLNKARRKDAQ